MLLAGCETEDLVIRNIAISGASRPDFGLIAKLGCPAVSSDEKCVSCVACAVECGILYRALSI